MPTLTKTAERPPQGRRHKNRGQGRRQNLIRGTGMSSRGTLVCSRLSPRVRWGRTRRRFDAPTAPIRPTGRIIWMSIRALFICGWRQFVICAAKEGLSKNTVVLWQKIIFKKSWHMLVEFKSSLGFYHFYVFSYCNHIFLWKNQT